MPKWLICSIVTMICFGGWLVVSNLAGLYMSPCQLQVVSTLGLLPAVLVLLVSKNLFQGSAKTRGSVYALLAGLLTGVGNIAYYVAASKGGEASTVMAVTALYPLVTVVLAMIFLRERLNFVQVLGIGVALAAMYMFNVSEEKGLISVWLLYSLIPIALWGITGLIQKVASNMISSELLTLWFLAAFVPIAGAIFLAEPMKIIPSMTWSLPAKAWFYAVLCGALYGFGNLALIAAYGSGGKASIVTPLSGLYPIVGIPLALLLLHESMNLRKSVGIGLALAGIVALSCEKKPEKSSEAAVSPVR